jgi:hypothetical protein
VFDRFREPSGQISRTRPKGGAGGRGAAGAGEREGWHRTSAVQVIFKPGDLLLVRWFSRQ